MADYVIVTDTAPDSQRGFGAGSHTIVHLVGTSDQSGPVELDDPKRDDFEPGNSDAFPLTLPELGELRMVNVEVTGSQAYSWHLQQIRVERRENGQTVRSWSAYNPANPMDGCWFTKDTDWRYSLFVR